MRARIIYVSLVFLAVFSSEVIFGKRIENRPQLSVRQSVDAEIFNLMRNLESPATSEGQWQALQKTMGSIEVLRSQNSRQFEGDELYMDTIVAGLDRIPGKSQGRAEECFGYGNQIQGQLDGQNAHKSNLALSQVLSVVKLLCREGREL